MLKAVCAGLIFTLSGFANAGIIDHGGYTEVNGIDWLDWTSTLDMTQSQALAANVGWRAATLTEVRVMMNEVFETTFAWGDAHSISSGFGINISEKNMMFNNLFGCTRCSPNDNVTYALINGVGLVGTYRNMGGYTQVFAGYGKGYFGQVIHHQTNAGVALVRGASNEKTEVPEPTTLAIFALGMMGLASRRFKKQS